MDPSARACAIVEDLADTHESSWNSGAPFFKDHPNSILVYVSEGREGQNRGGDTIRGLPLDWDLKEW